MKETEVRIDSLPNPISFEGKGQSEYLLALGVSQRAICHIPQRSLRSTTEASRLSLGIHLMNGFATLSTTLRKTTAGNPLTSSNARFVSRYNFSVTSHSQACLAPASTVNYHLACKLSSNFVAIGDSAMRANPVYGLGTTKAMVGSVTLSGVLHEARHLSSLPPTFSRQFFQRQHDRTVWHW